MSVGVWEDSMNKALNRHNIRLRRLRERMAKAEQGLENSRNNLEEIKAQLEAEIENSGDELKKILSGRNDPVVDVRNYNETTVDVCHGSSDCGWFPAGSKALLLSEARDAGLRPCVSCGRFASAPAAAWRASAVRCA
jgi:hypothetical protein